MNDLRADEIELAELMVGRDWRLRDLFREMRRRGRCEDDTQTTFDSRIWSRSKSPHSRIQRVRRAIYTMTE